MDTAAVPPASAPASKPLSPAQALDSLSVIKLYGLNDEAECGYCKQKGGKSSFGMVSHQMTAADYQSLIDVGWRRSGTYLYHPCNATTCCPNITIRLDTDRFVMNKDQKRLMRRFNQYLTGELEATMAAEAKNTAESKGADKKKEVAAEAAPVASKPTFEQEDPLAAFISSLLSAAVASFLDSQGDQAKAAVPTVSSLQPLVVSVAGSPGLLLGTKPSLASPVALKLFGVLKKAGLTTVAIEKPSDVGKSLAQSLVSSQDSSIFSSSVDEASGVISLRPSDAAAKGSIHISVAPSGHLNFAFPDGGAADASGNWLPVAASSSRRGSLAGPSSASPQATAGPAASAAPVSPAAAVVEPEAKRQKKNSAASPVNAGAGAGAGSVKLKPHDFSVTMVPAAFDRECHALYKRYQMAVHGDEPSECSEKQYTRFLCESALMREPFSSRSATMTAAGGGAFFESSLVGKALKRCIDEEATVWREGDGVGAGLPAGASGSGSESGSNSGASASAADLRFAVLSDDAGSPASAGSGAGSSSSSEKDNKKKSAGGTAGSSFAGSDLTLGFGTFHMLYRIDGKLIAVGVVDVLPHCLSSVYAYYDPDFSKRYIELGKLTALFEIAWVQRVARLVSPRLRHYYLGFYINSCTKMRYKGDYGPADLLCPYAWTWRPLAECKPLLDADKHAILDPKLRDDPAGAATALAELKRQRAAAVAAVAGTIPLLLQKKAPDALVLIRDLSEQGKAIAKRAILEFLERCTPAISKRLVIQF